MEYVKLGIGTQDIPLEMQNTTGYAYVTMYCGDLVYLTFNFRYTTECWIFKPFNTRIQDFFHKLTYIHRKIHLCTCIYVHIISVYVDASSLMLLLAIWLNDIADENSRAPQIPQHKIKIDMVNNTYFIT